MFMLRVQSSDDGRVLMVNEAAAFLSVERRGLPGSMCRRGNVPQLGNVRHDRPGDVTIEFLLS
jgi:hypothetical protein